MLGFGGKYVTASEKSKRAEEEGTISKSKRKVQMIESN